MEARDRIIVALDVDDIDTAYNLVLELYQYVGAFKVGLEFISSMMASMICGDSLEARSTLSELRHLFKVMEGKVFWDGKLDDIPNTVAGASKAIARMRVKMFNVHASAGSEAVKRAVQSKGDSLVLGVTVLTSIGADECLSIFGNSPDQVVLNFAGLLSDAGADGVICSPKELSILCGDSSLANLMKITPGVRPLWADINDQKRVMTPSEAIMAGADMLVIGRPLTQPNNMARVEAAQRIILEIDEAVRHGIIKG